MPTTETTRGQVRLGVTGKEESFALNGPTAPRSAFETMVKETSRQTLQSPDSRPTATRLQESSGHELANTDCIVDIGSTNGVCVLVLPTSTHPEWKRMSPVTAAGIIVWQVPAVADDQAECLYLGRSVHHLDHPG